MHPDFMFAALSSRQIAELMAYHSLEPFGYKGDWWRAAKIMETIANVFRGKGQKPLQAKDFMPKIITGRPEIQSLEDQKAAIMAIHKGSQRGKKAPGEGKL